jgi:hypothetical protein
MKIKRYYKFVNEDLKSDLTSNLEGENKDLKESIIEKIIKSLNTDDKKVFDDFVSAYIKDSEKNQIEGLINDSDIYEFYLSNRNDIDALLSKINFYEENPSEMNSFSLYDYVVKGTKKAISEIVISLKEDTTKEEPKEETETTSEETE